MNRKNHDVARDFPDMPPNKNHWSECGRATSVANSEALGRPHRSLFSFGNKPHDWLNEITCLDMSPRC